MTFNILTPLPLFLSLSFFLVRFKEIELLKFFKLGSYLYSTVLQVF